MSAFSRRSMAASRSPTSRPAAYTLLFAPPDGSTLAGAWYQSLTEQGAVYFTIANADVDLGSTALGSRRNDLGQRSCRQHSA